MAAALPDIVDRLETLQGLHQQGELTNNDLFLLSFMQVHEIPLHCSPGIQHGPGAGGQRAAEADGEPELERGDAEADAEHVRQERREGRPEPQGDGRAPQEARKMSCPPTWEPLPLRFNVIRFCS